jgi:DNA topoisomerase-3
VQVGDIVNQVIADQSNRRVPLMEESAKTKGKKARPSGKTGAAPTPPDDLVGKPCPLCGKGHIIKGKTAYGCSEWKNGCTWRQPFADER